MGTGITFVGAGAEAGGAGFDTGAGVAGVLAGDVVAAGVGAAAGLVAAGLSAEGVGAAGILAGSEGLFWAGTATAGAAGTAVLLASGTRDFLAAPPVWRERRIARTALRMNSVPPR